MPALYFRGFQGNTPLGKMSPSWHVVADKLVNKGLATWSKGKLQLAEGVTIKYVDSRGNLAKE